MFQRRLDQLCLIIQKPLAFLPFKAHHVGDVGLDDDRAAIGRSVFTNLEPPAAGHTHIKDRVVVLVPRHAESSPALRVFTVRQRKIGAAGHEVDVFRKGQTGFEQVIDVQHVLAETAVAHDQFFLRIEKRKAFLNGFQRIGEVGPRGFGFRIGPGQFGVRYIEQIQRTLKFLGAHPHFFFEHDGALELPIGRARGFRALLDPAHQGFGDLQQLFILPLK